MVSLKIGQKFESFHSFEKHFKAYQEEVKQHFSQSRTTSSTSKELLHRKIDVAKFPHYYVEYHCYYGEQTHESQSTGQRKSRSSKMGCPAVVKARLDKNNQNLVIKTCNLVHSSVHENSEIFYDTIPSVRRLSDESKKTVAHLMKLKCNKKLLQTELHESKKKNVTLKDLSNIKNNLAQGNPNNFSDVIQILQSNGADYAVYTDKKVFKALFFQTEDMKLALKLWPEILFIDGTYRLTNINLTLMLIVVEDSDGKTRIVAACLLESEDAAVLTWFFENFKMKNKEACAKVVNLMTDKDHTQRSVLRKVFPDAKLLLCLFHTLQTFGRQVTTANMNVTLSERNLCLDLLQKIAYSKSSEKYDSNYAEFCNKAPRQVVDYFNTNWHNIKDEWVVGLMQNMNLKNNTNNRLESLNSKVKQVVEKNSSLLNFVTSFFVFLTSQTIERNADTAQSFTKTMNSSVRNEETKQYESLLTAKALSYVLPEIDSSKYITIYDQNPLQFECSTKEDSLVITSTISRCNCAHYRSLELPCKHIFATRKFYRKPLFCPTLCNIRWTKGHALKGKVELKKKGHDQISIPNSFPIKTDQHLGTSTQGTIQTKMQVRMNNLVFIGSLSTGWNFDEKVDALQSLIMLWNKGTPVQVRRKMIQRPNSETKRKLDIAHRRKILLDLKNVILSEENITEEKLAQLQDIENIWKADQNVEIKGTVYHRMNDAEEETTAMNVSDIVIPNKIIIRGKPRGAGETFIGKRKGCSNDNPCAKKRKI